MYHTIARGGADSEQNGIFARIADEELILKFLQLRY